MERVVVGRDFGEAEVEFSEFDRDQFVITCSGDSFRFSRRIRLDEDLGVADGSAGLLTYFESLLLPWPSRQESRDWGGKYFGLHLLSTSDGCGHVQIEWRVGHGDLKYLRPRWAATVVTTLDVSTVERTTRHLRAFFHQVT